MTNYLKNREFLKCDYKLLKNNFLPPVKQGIAQPDMVKKATEGKKIIKLPKVNPKTDILHESNIEQCISNRKSRRKFEDKQITIEELSFLLWTTQGIKDTIDKDGRLAATFRTVPSGGARHAFETYLLISNVNTIETGIYRYLPLSHELQLIANTEEDFMHDVVKALANQNWAFKAGVVFVWAAIPFRAEWRFDMLAHKMMLLDAGHICQNLYLACESMKLGTCAIAIYDQEKIDKMLQLDGENEFSVYIAPVGKIANDDS